MGKEDYRYKAYIYKKVKEDSKRFSEYNKYKYKCKCGHTVSIPSFADKVLCSFCGNYAFKTKREEFFYRTKEKLKDVRTK